MFDVPWRGGGGVVRHSREESGRGPDSTLQWERKGGLVRISKGRVESGLCLFFQVGLEREFSSTPQQKNVGGPIRLSEWSEEFLEAIDASKLSS